MEGAVVEEFILKDASLTITDRVPGGVKGAFVVSTQDGNTWPIPSQVVVRSELICNARRNAMLSDRPARVKLWAPKGAMSDYLKCESTLKQLKQGDTSTPHEELPRLLMAAHFFRDRHAINGLCDCISRILVPGSSKAVNQVTPAAGQLQSPNSLLPTQVAHMRRQETSRALDKGAVCTSMLQRLRQLPVELVTAIFERFPLPERKILRQLHDSTVAGGCDCQPQREPVDDTLHMTQREMIAAVSDVRTQVLETRVENKEHECGQGPACGYDNEDGDSAGVQAETCATNLTEVPQNEQLSQEEIEFYQHLRADHITNICTSKFKYRGFYWLAQAILSCTPSSIKKLHLRIDQDNSLVHAQAFPPMLLHCEKKALASELAEGLKGSWTDKQKVCVAQFLLDSSLAAVFEQLANCANMQALPKLCNDDPAASPSKEWKVKAGKDILKALVSTHSAF